MATIYQNLSSYKMSFSTFCRLFCQMLCCVDMFADLDWCGSLWLDGLGVLEPLLPGWMQPSTIIEQCRAVEIPIF